MIFISVNLIFMNKTSQVVKYTTRILFSFFIGLIFHLQAFAQDFPPVAKDLVTDYTNTLNSSQKQELERKLLAFEDSTSIQIAVVVMNSTGDYDIADYGDRLAK